MCQRAEHRSAAGLAHAEVEVFLDGIAAIAEPVDVHFLWRPQLRDPSDELVLEAALNGQADALVTFNRRHFGRTPGRFAIEIILPAEAVRRVRG